MDQPERTRSNLPTLPPTQLADFLQLCTGAPEDWPLKGMATQALVICFDALKPDYPDFGEFVNTQLRSHVTAFACESVSARDPLAGRNASFRLYGLLLEVHRRHQVISTYKVAVLRLIGTWMLRQYLTNRPPSDAAVQIIKKIVRNPSAVHDSIGCVDRYLTRASASLRKDIEQNKRRAAEIGLAELDDMPDASPTAAQDSVTTFNADLQRTWRSHIRDASPQDVQGTLGKGTLARSGLEYAGREIAKRLRSGDHEAIGISLQVITRLPSRLLKTLPLRPTGGQVEPLVWLDIEAGEYVVNPTMFVDLAQSPVEYGETMHVHVSYLSVRLPQILIDRLQRLAKKNPAAVVLGDLIQIEEVNPRSTLIESHGYRITLSRIQNSLPALALSQGHHRWPVALACQSWWLVSRGRRAYSVCESRDVDAVMNEIYKSLRWGGLPIESGPTTYIGSPLTPSLVAIRRAAGFLKAECSPASNVTTVEQLNAWAAHAAFVLSLTLALRARTTYPLNWQDLWGRDQTIVNDKEVERDPTPPIPVNPPTTAVIEQWQQVVAAFVAYCKESGHDKASVADAIEALHLKYGGYPVFSVDGAGSIRMAGTDTWRRALPPLLRLAPNFGRHLWPWRLQRAGVAQRCVDILMRHRTSYMDHYSGYTANSYKADFERLRDAMEAELALLLGTNSQAREVGDEH